MKLRFSENIFLIFFSVLFLSITLFLNRNIPNSSHIYQDIDSKAYISNAMNFYTYYSFVDPANPSADPYYSLGYAFFLALIYKIFGTCNFIVVLIQIFLALLSAFLIFRITRLLFDTKVALVSFAFSCFNLGFIVFSQFILTEILLTFFLVLFLERFILFLKETNSCYLLQSGFVLGVSIVIKPAAIYFVFFIVFFLLFFIKEKLRNRFFKVFLFCFAFYLPVISYMIFNKVQFGHFCLAQLKNENVYLYFLPKILAIKNNSDYSSEVKKVTSLLTGSKLSLQSWEKINDLFLEYLKKDPLLFVKIWMLNVLKTFVGLFTTNLKVLLEPDLRGGDISFFRTSGNLYHRVWSYVSGGTDSWGIKIVGIWEAFWSLLRYILIFIALIFLITKKRWAEIFFFVTYIFYFSMITGHDGCARFRMMFEPVLIVLTALGFAVIVFKNPDNNFC